MRKKASFLYRWMTPVRTTCFNRCHFIQSTNSKQGQELTYAVLSRTRNEAAVDVLLACLDSELHEHRDMALSTLLQRREDRVPAKLLARWQQLKTTDHLLLRTRKTWFEGAVSQALKHRGADTSTAIAAAESLELTKFIPMLVDLAETGETEEIQQRATAAVLKLAHILGGRARCDRDTPTIRNAALERLHKSLGTISQHDNVSLADAFLVLSIWGDSELRKVMSEPTPIRKLILERFFGIQAHRCSGSSGEHNQTPSDG